MAGQAEKVELSLQQLCDRLERLENRVALLEETRPKLPPSTPEQTLLGIKPREEKEPRLGFAAMVPILGKAVLAIAGAYLLRALAESGAAPRRLLLLIAIGYAGAWVVLAGRARWKSPVASVTFATTAALIVTPLLWEGTVRFQELTAGFASVVLAGYFALSLALSWKDKLEAIPWIAAVAAVATALTLLVATHELKPLTVGLLVMASLAEIAGWSGRWLGLRAVPALGADFAVVVLGLVMTSAQGIPEGYPQMHGTEITALGVALLVIYGGSFGARGFVLKEKWTFGELAQLAVAFGLSTWLILRATHDAAPALSTLLGLLSLVFYWEALRRFTGATLQRNRVASLNLGAASLLAGVFLAANIEFRAVLLSVAAIAAVVLFAKTGQLSLALHGTLYLLAASIVCGLFGYMGKALAGTVPAWPDWSFWLVSAACVASYFLGSRQSGEGKSPHLLWAVPVAIVGSAVAALMVTAVSRLGGGELSVSRLSMVRTMVTCVLALGLAYAGSRWHRPELRWVAYAAVGLGALKLVLEDLRFGNAGTLMVSLLFYGLILILLPRVARFGRATS